MTDSPQEPPWSEATIVQRIRIVTTRLPKTWSQTQLMNEAADRIEALEREMGERYSREGMLTMLARAETAEAALREAQKDAERYRWLRVEHVDAAFLRQDGEPIACLQALEDLDAAIDAARKVGTEGPA